MKNIFNLFKSILLLPWRMLTWLRQILANLLLLVLIVAIAGAYFSYDEFNKPSASLGKGVLVIEPSGSIVEQMHYIDPFVLLMEEEGTKPQETLLYDITLSIQQATNDDNVTALVLDTSWMTSADPSKLFSIGAAIEQFKTSGKPVFAVGDSYSQAQYFIASYADQILLNPMGSVFLKGFGAYPSFYKEALDKLKINVHVFRVGDYKSFVEPFVRNDMSPQAKQNAQLWLDDIWLAFAKEIERQRQLQPNSVNHYINYLDVNLKQVQGDAAKLALQAGLIDKIASRDEIEQIIIDATDKDDSEGEKSNSGSFPRIDFQDYVKSLPASSYASNRVGVIVAKGAIMDGEQDPGTIGGDSLATQIRDAREDKNIKALVLRIDSPGGSAFASEVIRRELELTQAAGIPVIASFGGVAASGGYWIAASADEIWSTPTTITGSIGVFGMIPTFENSFTSLGIHSDGVGTTALANAWHLDQAMNPILERSVQLEVEHTYQQFLQLVAKGRGSDKQTIHTNAQGQVWSGITAQKKQLVDHIGDLDQAIAAAAQKAGLGDDYEWEFIEKQLSPREQLLLQLTTQTRQVLSELRSQKASSGLNKMVVQVLDKTESLLLSLSAFNDPKGIYLQCLQCQISE